jgi:hypothetical protein
MAHILKKDRRLLTLIELLKPFQIKLYIIKSICKSENYVNWDSVYSDDLEDWVGGAFIFIQNYINSSISDLYPNLKEQYKIYNCDVKFYKTNISRIDLIIAIANYYKHRDSPPPLHKNTSKIFEILKIDYKENVENKNDQYSLIIGANSPIYSGFSFLSSNWDLEDIVVLVSEWREKMWLEYEKNNSKY